MLILFSLVDMFNQKAFFLAKKISVLKYETDFSRDAMKVKRGKVLKENFTIGKSLNSARLFRMQNYNENADEDESLTAENVC